MPARLKLKVVPGASRSRIVGWLGDRLKVTVAAPPESGKANAAVIDLLASSLSLRPADLQITAGHTNPLKELLISSLTPEQLAHKLPP